MRLKMPRQHSYGMENALNHDGKTYFPVKERVAAKKNLASVSRAVEKHQLILFAKDA